MKSIALCGAIFLAFSTAAEADGHDLKQAQSERITGYIQALSDEAGLSLADVMAQTFPDREASGSMPGMMTGPKTFPSGWDVVVPGDFGFVATDTESGKVVDIFNKDAPVVQMGDKLAIAGYPQSESVAIRTVAGDEWGAMKAKYGQEYLDQYMLQSRETRAGRAIDDVAQKAHEATMIWAANLCPQYVYPARVTLFLDAGFDFVVVNTQTGTQIEIIMQDACNGLERLLEVEAAKNGIVVD